MGVGVGPAVGSIVGATVAVAVAGRVGGMVGELRAACGSTADAGEQAEAMRTIREEKKIRTCLGDKNVRTSQRSWLAAMTRAREFGKS